MSLTYVALLLVVAVGIGLTTVFTGDIYPQLMISHRHSKDRSLLRVAGNAIFWPSELRFADDRTGRTQ